MNPNPMFSAEAFEVFYQSLSVMAAGMFGVFIFMAIFSAIILGLVKGFPHQTNDHEAEA